MNPLFALWDKKHGCWNKGRPSMDSIFMLLHRSMIALGSNRYELRRAVGMKDINGCEIFEGDRVVVYPENYAKTLVEDDDFGPKVYDVDHSKPLPLLDVVLCRGTIVYEAPSFWVEVDKGTYHLSSVSIRGHWIEVIKKS